jgi:dihydrofolate reductase
MQISVDGFVAGPNGELDWMTWNWDDELKKFADRLHEPVDTILLGRNMTDGFINHWTDVTKNPEDESHEFAKKMVDTPKVVFSTKLDKSKWPNTYLAKNIVEDVNCLKKSEGGDIIVYGGAGFVSSLIKENLIDDYYLYTNPTAVGKGMRIFEKAGQNLSFALAESTPFECGIVVNHYTRT